MNDLAQPLLPCFSVGNVDVVTFFVSFQDVSRKGQALLEVKKLEIKAKADSIRLPSGGDEPPEWSKKLKTYKRNLEQQ